MRVVVTERGGHCGFLPSLSGDSWIDGVMAEWFAAAGRPRPGATRP